MNVKNRENHVENWLTCIKSRMAPNADVELGHRSATVCHLGNIARWTNRKLRWDPASERFLEDAEADAYLDSGSPQAVRIARDRLTHAPSPAVDQRRCRTKRVEVKLQRRGAPSWDGLALG